MSVEVRIPSTSVSSGWGTPTVCAKHGEPAVEGKKAQFISTPPGWSYALLLLGVLPFAIAMLATRKTVEAKAWPFCAQCVQGRKRGLLIGLGFLAAAILAFASSAVLPSDQSVLVALLGVLLLLAGFIVAVRSANRALLAGGQVTRDGQEVEFRKAHESFAAQAATAQQSAAQQYAGRQ